MKCSECGAEVREGSRFCSRCGTPIALAPVKEPDFVPDPGSRIDLPDPAITYVGQAKSGLRYQLIGTTLQAVTVELGPRQTVQSESGGMAWMSANVRMQATSGGRLDKMLGRVFSGESLFLVDYSCPSGQGLVSFACKFPGKIVPIDLVKGQSIIAQKKRLYVC